MDCYDNYPLDNKDAWLGLVHGFWLRFSLIWWEIFSCVVIVNLPFLIIEQQNFVEAHDSEDKVAAQQKGDSAEADAQRYCQTS